MYKHTGQGLVGYFWNGVLVNVRAYVCVAYSANINYLNFNEYKIKMVTSFTITKKTLK